LLYKEFRFQNFKGIEDMTLALNGEVTTLIGLNESGKTTILEAIYCFEYGAEDLDAINPGMASLHEQAQWIPIAQRANFNDDIKISALVALDGNDKRGLRRFMLSAYNLTLSRAPDEINITERYLFKDSRYDKKKRSWSLNIDGTKGLQRIPRHYDSSTPEWQGAVKYLTDRLPRIWYFPNFLFELPEKFTITDPTDSDDEEVDDKNQFYRSTFENILGQTVAGATLQTHIIERMQSTQRTDQRNLDALLLAMSESVTRIVFEGWNRIFGRTAPAAQEVQIDAEHAPDDGAYLELKIKGPDGYYDLSERSLGFRWFFMFLLMTSFHGNSHSHSKPLFLLDEPASNLHSSAQAELLKSFENLVDRCHLVYATHSHHLINVRWLDGAYVVKNDALGSLEIADYLNIRMGARTSITATRYRQFVAEHPDQTSYFQPVLDLLDYQPSALEPVPDVVLVEGKSDFYLMRYMTEVLGVEPELKTVPGGGASSLDSLIRLHIGWGKSFLILLDGDAEGIKQRARYELEFGPLIKARCVLLPDMCGDPQVREAEDLLSDADKAQLTSAVFAAGVQRPTPKKALRQAVIELYARKQAVSVKSITVRRFERLVSELRQRLE